MGCSVSSGAWTRALALGLQLLVPRGGKDKGDSRRYFEIMRMAVRSQQGARKTIAFSI